MRQCTLIVTQGKTVIDHRILTFDDNKSQTEPNLFPQDDPLHIGAFTGGNLIVDLVAANEQKIHKRTQTPDMTHPYKTFYDLPYSDGTVYWI